MKLKTLREYLDESYSIKKLMDKVACCNCGSKQGLIADPDTDSFVCEFCAKNSYMNEDNDDVIWCEVKKENKR